MRDNGGNLRTISGTAGLALALALSGATTAARAQAAGAPPTTGGAVSNPDQDKRAEQQRSAESAVKADEAQDAATAANHAGVLIDRVVAVVNGEVVLESDVEEERRMAAFQPISSPEGTATRERAIERLVNRKLLLQQAKLQPQHAITEADIDAQLDQLQKEIPACKEAHCETDAGWAKFLASHGVTSNEVRAHFRERMEALQFIEVRFRSGIRISQAEIQSYYNKTMLPEYAKQKVKAPSLDKLSDRIQEVLLQQQVSGLLSDWLKSLRAQGTVQMVQDGADPA